MIHEIHIWLYEKLTKQNLNTIYFIFTSHSFVFNFEVI